MLYTVLGIVEFLAVCDSLLHQCHNEHDRDRLYSHHDYDIHFDILSKRDSNHSGGTPIIR